MRRLFLGGAVFLLLGGFICGQVIDDYLQLIQEGKVETVREQIPELQSRYPDSPDILYLKALTTQEGDSALAQFKVLVKEYSQSQWADDAAMKIGEYLYARGLYTQAARQCRTIPEGFPQSDHLQQAMDLMVLSYRATGEEDSAKVYLRRFMRKYPQLEYERYGFADLGALEPVRLVKINEKTAAKKLASTKSKRTKTTPQKQTEAVVANWVVQVGAFGKYKNARRVREMLQQGGYTVEINQVVSNGRRLHAVRVGPYQTKDKATRIGKEIQRKFGLEYRVLKR
jgi:tetratricopeptide (TPR) repeat protein